MITIYIWFGYDLETKERYRLIKKAGFDGVKIWWSDNFGCWDFHSHPKYAQNAGLFIEDIHTPYEDVNNLWLDNIKGKELTESLISYIDDCSTYNIPTMVLHLTNGNNPPCVNKLGIDRIKSIVERAEQRNVNVAVENLRTTDHIEAVFNEIKSKRIGFCYDSGHHNCRTPNEDLLTRYGEKLMTLHLHDNDGYINGAGDEDQHRLPFDGNINWEETMKKIAYSNFLGATALEVMNFSYESMKPEEFLEAAYEKAKRLDILRDKSTKL